MKSYDGKIPDDERFVNSPTRGANRIEILQVDNIVEVGGNCPTGLFTQIGMAIEQRGKGMLILMKGKIRVHGVMDVNVGDHGNGWMCVSKPDNKTIEVVIDAKMPQGAM